MINGIETEFGIFANTKQFRNNKGLKTLTATVPVV
jgi:hypothetical protein